MVIDETVHIGALYIRLFIRESQSLKGKRAVIRSLKDRIRSKFNVSVSEIGGLDKWQVAVLGMTMIMNDQRLIDATFQNILSLVEQSCLAEICEHSIEFY